MFVNRQLISNETKHQVMTLVSLGDVKHLSALQAGQEILQEAVRDSVTLDTCILCFPTKGFLFGLSCLTVSLLKKVSGEMRVRC